MRRGAAILTLLCLLAACRSLAPYRASTLPTALPPDDLYAAAVRVFVRQGWGLQSRDAEARVVETDWVQQDGTYGPGGSVVWLSYRVLVSDGVIELFTSCEMGGLTRRPCPDDERPPGTADVERELFDAIIAETETVAH